MKLLRINSSFILPVFFFSLILFLFSQYHTAYSATEVVPNFPGKNSCDADALDINKDKWECSNSSDQQNFGKSVVLHHSWTPWHGWGMSNEYFVCPEYKGQQSTCRKVNSCVQCVINTQSSTPAPGTIGSDCDRPIHCNAGLTCNQSTGRCEKSSLGPPQLPTDPGAPAPPATDTCTTRGNTTIGNQREYECQTSCGEGRVRYSGNNSSCTSGICCRLTNTGGGTNPPSAPNPGGGNSGGSQPAPTRVPAVTCTKYYGVACGTRLDSTKTLVPNAVKSGSTETPPYKGGQYCGGEYYDVYQCSDGSYQYRPGDDSADDYCNTYRWCSVENPPPTLPDSCGGDRNDVCKYCGGVDMTKKSASGHAGYYRSQCGGEGYDASKASTGAFCGKTYEDVYWCRGADAQGRNYDIIPIPEANDTCNKDPWCPSVGPTINPIITTAPTSPAISCVEPNWNCTDALVNDASNNCCKTNPKCRTLLGDSGASCKAMSGTAFGYCVNAGEQLCRPAGF